jgi:MFS family permease
VPGVSATSRFPFLRLMTASGLSNLADGVLKTAIPLVALRYTTSPAQIAGLTLAITLPWLVAALPAGALVDRWDRRATMLIANSVRAGVLGLVALVAATGAGSIWWLYAGAIFVGTAEVFHDTTAQSILPMIVPRTRLQKANGRLYALELTANSFVGPPLGGVVAAAGIAVALGAPAGLWVLAVLVLATLRGTFRVERTTKTSLRADVAEGLRFLWQRPVLRTLATWVGVSNLAWTAGQSVIVLWAVGPSSTLKLTDPQYGVLLTTLAVGAVVGSLIADWVAGRIGRTASLVASMVASALGLATPLLTTNIWVIGTLFAISGLGISLWNVITVSLRQRLTPDRLLGRLNSAYRLLAWGTMPLGAALGGALGQAFGVEAVFAVGTALTLALLTLTGQLTPSRLAAAESSAEPEVVASSATSAHDEPHA